MTLAERDHHVDKKRRGHRIFGDPQNYIHEWPHESPYGHGYDFEDELCDHLVKLPTPEEVIELCSALRVATLHELSAEIVNGSIEYVKGDTDRLAHVKLLNSWIATAEETVAAGNNVKRIAARRRKQSQ